jgi:hypothetical protein
VPIAGHGGQRRAYPTDFFVIKRGGRSVRFCEALAVTLASSNFHARQMLGAATITTLIGRRLRLRHNPQSRPP